MTTSVVHRTFVSVSAVCVAIEVVSVATATPISAIFVLTMMVTGSVPQTFVDVYTGALVSVGLVPVWTKTVEAPLCVQTAITATTVSNSTLVHI